jgi:hypothetical protein
MYFLIKLDSAEQYKTTRQKELDEIKIQIE